MKDKIKEMIDWHDNLCYSKESDNKFLDLLYREGEIWDTYTEECGEWHALQNSIFKFFGEDGQEDFYVKASRVIGGSVRRESGYDFFIVAPREKTVTVYDNIY